MQRLLCLFLLIMIPVSAFGADDMEQRIKTLEDASKKQERKIEEQQKIIENLDKSRAPEAVQPAAPVGIFGGSVLANPNISLILDTFYYSSNIKGSDLPSRSIPGYTNSGIDKTKGFNLESAELFIFAPVDPYFNFYSTLPFTDNGVTLEEAFFNTTSLPAGLQVKGGKFKSGFGRLSAQHRHAWDFEDAPLVYRAFTGEEGIDEKGLQITYLPELPFYLISGIEVLQGENSILFGPDAKPGPHAFTGFAKASFDISDDSTVLFGPSVITGKTKTNTVADSTRFIGTSTLYDFEFTYKWKPSKERSVTIQSEYTLRDQKGDLIATSTPPPPSGPLKRTQDGVYVQSLYQIGRWRIGARYDRLDLLKSSYILNNSDQEFSRKPWRATGSLEFNPTEFSRIRVQYSYDRSARTGVNNEIITQLILGIGAHAAHTF